jgi:hypothetical protein
VGLPGVFMRPITGWLAAVFSVLLASCAGNGDLVSPGPYVVYHTDDNIEITQYFTGAQQRFDEAKAVELLTNECGGAYRIVKRTKTEDGHIFVDAVCIH